jgi:hypothetical protein
MTDALITLPRSEEGSHWYTELGEPCYEVPTKSRPGETRPVDLRDARKRNLFPSVSNIQSLLAKPAIVKWQLRHYLEEALTHPTGNVREIMAAAETRMAEAPSAGSLYHAAIEAAINDGAPAPEGVPQETVDAVLEWLWRYGVQVEELEVAFSCWLGYGGRIDLVGTWINPETNTRRPLVLDWKSKAGKLTAWPENCTQLAAYCGGVGLSLEDTDLVNVLVSRDWPGLIEAKVWKLEEKRRRSDQFHHMLLAWQLEKGYVPEWSQELAGGLYSHDMSYLVEVAQEQGYAEGAA